MLGGFEELLESRSRELTRTLFLAPSVWPRLQPFLLSAMTVSHGRALQEKILAAVNNVSEPALERHGNCLGILNHFYLCRVNPLPVSYNFKEKMVSGGSTGGSHKSDSLPLPDFLACLDQYATEMAVTALVTVFMTKAHVETVSGSTALKSDRAVGNGVYWRPGGSAIINPGMKFRYIEYRMNSPAIPGRDTKCVKGCSKIVSLQLHATCIKVLAIEQTRCLGSRTLPSIDCIENSTISSRFVIGIAPLEHDPALISPSHISLKIYVPSKDMYELEQQVFAFMCCQN